MEILTVYPQSINMRHIAQAADVLRRGGVVIYPTDTVYALGCSALDKHAIERLCRIKGLNPDKHLLSIVCADISQASEYATIDNRAYDVMRRALPGPYTFILPPSGKLPKAFKGRKTVGVRIPANEISRALAAELGHPLLTTSVDVEDVGHDVLITDVESLDLAYGDLVDLGIDGGQGGEVPSTIVDLTDSQEPVLVRQGAGPWS